jgi:hypothetical protein
VKGFLAFFSACALVATLSVIPAEHARWVALALLVLVALTPAVGELSPGRRRGKLKIGARSSGPR